ncbi:hypothetical protein GIB67_013982 [Kingdonia uniflora]|uniref:Uncharacterized protein n=1 Tax=Kingdonia uniflora TaxID=39325 RepID=A0A7J7LDR7_9MAGN|nr:hypothetical protein GIB67_013982 [Kingdonia uniflora]
MMEDEVLNGAIYPSISSIRDIMKEVAAAVVTEAIKEDLAEGYHDMDARELQKLSQVQLKSSVWSERLEDSMSVTFSILWRSHKGDWERFPSFSWHFILEPSPLHIFLLCSFLFYFCSLKSPIILLLQFGVKKNKLNKTLE